MIELTTPTSSGLITHYLAPQAIARITTASTSSQWHGIRAIVKTFDGKTIECTESAEDIAAAIRGQQ